jgi:hypothetical protein
MIETKIEITTPPGKSDFVLFALKDIVLKLKGIWKCTYYTNPEGTKIYLEINCTPKQYVKLFSTAAQASSLFKSVWEMKWYQSIVRSKLTPEETKDLKTALVNNTKIRLINKIEADKQLIEYFNSKPETFWNKIKRTFKKEEKEL